jgi:ribonuclease HII
MLPPPRTLIRRDGGIYALERALQRRGFDVVAGADEAGRGACAGPLVVAAAILPANRRGEVPGLNDSKLLTPAARERVYAEVVARALDYAIVVIPPDEVDRRGLHVCNVAGMRRALAALTPRPQYALTDGFGVPGLGLPSLAVWKGDQVAACVAAASVLAKVTRDRIMIDMDGEFPLYGFAEHKGYVTEEHSEALTRHGPCVQHRFSYINVAAALVRTGPDSVVGSAGRRRRSTVSVSTVASLGGPAGAGRRGGMEGGTE